MVVTVWSRRASFALAVFAAVAILPLAPASAQNTRSQGGWDPFRVPVPAKKAGAPRVLEPGEISAPPFAARVKQCDEAGRAAGRTIASTPCPYLVGELRVTGVFTSDDGIGAFVEASPNKQTFFLRKGDKLFDGEVLSIRPQGADGAPAVVFKQVIYHRARGAVRSIERTLTVQVASVRLGA
jgi:hypothetical protein